MEQKSGHPLYKRAFWQKKRKAILSRNPLCQHCWNYERKVTPADCVDHVKSWTTKAEFVKGPFQALCKKCHSVKTAEIDKIQRREKLITDIRYF